MPSERLYSRESSALRRLLAAADSTTPPVSHVYGDASITTVVYQGPRARTDVPHRKMIGGCVAAFPRLERHGLAPDVIRGVCHLDDADTPLVWFLPRQWAIAYATDRLDAVDASEPIITGLAEHSSLTDLPIQESKHGSRNCTG